MHTGPVVAGVMGKKDSPIVVGDAVNTASRMESHGIPGIVHLSEATCQIKDQGFNIEDRGGSKLKVRE